MDARIPNAETVRALKDARDGVGLTEYASLEELKAEIDRPHVSKRKARGTAAS